MLYREDIIKILKDMDLPSNEYWITSGSALVMYGVKKATKDIDLGCTAYLWECLLQEGHTYRVEKDNSKLMEINKHVEIIKEYFVDEIELIDGLPTGSLKSIKKQKEMLGREKDIDDIRLINDYINSHSLLNDDVKYRD